MLNEVKHLMKKYLFIFPFLFLMYSIASARTALPDSLQMKALDAKLQEYFRAMEREDLEVQKQECDFIIGSAEDPDLRGIIAEKVYDHYMESRRMGAEGVSVHVYDKWFSDGTLKMSDAFKQLDARVYADFNRSSLLGCQAPQLRMQTMQGDSLTVFSSEKGRYKVLYFYDTDCTKCKAQTILLRNLMNVSDYPVDFYAIYVGDDRPQWEKYVAGHLGVSGAAVRAFHLWDAQLDSDFQKKYGLLQTPRIFLITPDGIVAGRGLDVESLAVMLEHAFAQAALVYGSEPSEQLFDTVFGGPDSRPSVADVISVADHIEVSTLEKADTTLYRQMTGDLMYYLAARTGEGCKEGLNHLIDNHILSKGDVWRTQDDSLKIIGMAQMLDDLLSKGEPGSMMPRIKVPGSLQKGSKTRSVVRRLDKLGGSRNVVIFFTEGCSVCAAERKAAEALRFQKGTRVFMVNMDEISSVDQNLASSLFDAFDMSVLPFLIQSDASGKICRRYFSLLE